MRVADNGTGLSTAYNGDGARRSVAFKVPDGDPTGIVRNTSRRLDIGEGARAAPARFVLASEAGVISAWSPKLDPGRAVVEFRAKDGAVYKGVAIDRVDGQPRVYATDFHNARVDVFDGSFRPVSVAGGFVDPHIPKGFAPFGIANVGGRLVVTYAKQDAARHDDVHGKGLGFVDVFDAQGHLLERLASRGPLNAPWGLALAPEGFGRFGGDLLVGNFGDGRIHAYDPASGKLEGTLRMANGKPVDIDGLWGLEFGNGAPGQPARTLFFAAGPNDEADGLFGSIRAVPGS
jgi:uncharacterized protein (TIGR03118 family)